MEHYKTEHKVLVKEAVALLELALWKANLPDEIDGNARKRLSKGTALSSSSNVVNSTYCTFRKV